MTDPEERALRLGVLVGSTRPGRRAREVTTWVVTLASRRPGLDIEVIDLADHDLPNLQEETPPMVGRYTRSGTLAFAEVIDATDAFVVVTPEYNHGLSGALKNALDHLYAEWNDKALGCVSYGVEGGLRAVEQLRLVAGELQLATVRNQVPLTLREDFADGTFAPRPDRADELEAMLDQLIGWAGALQTLRSTGPSAAPPRAALVVVDVQHLFVDPPHGFAGARDVVDRVTGWIDHAESQGWPVLLTRDVEPIPADEAAPDAAEVLPELVERGEVVEKGPGKDGGFSGFVLDRDGAGSGNLGDLAGRLRHHRVTEVVVVGLAADICVSATALDARRLGYEVTLPLEATAFAHAVSETEQETLDRLEAAGVRLVRGAVDRG